MRVTFQHKNRISTDTVYTAGGHKIVAMQIEQRDQTIKGRDEPHYLFILETSNKFKRILISGTIDVPNYTTDLVIDLSFHKEFKHMIDLLQKNYWSSLIMSEEGVLALEKLNKTTLISTLMSTQT